MTFSLPPRRRFMHRAAGLAAAGVLPLSARPAAAAAPKRLALFHLHTHERIDIVYAESARYVPEALGSLDRFLRDHYSGDVGTMDPQLFDLLHEIRHRVGAARPFEVISAFRAAHTNETLRRTRGGGVAPGSLHLTGRAIDVRLPGVALADLRQAALSLRAGGVGYYPRENFVHIDTGRVRQW
ncbi:MAG: DUF882 domain-containing protein [Burkholderiaceae bacterium]|nr:DUF882 domain-containing protein [Burkholderiaceae bacterium]